MTDDRIFKREQMSEKDINIMNNALDSFYEKYYNKKWWKISGINLPTIKVYANSFDEALKIARNKNKDYNTGQLIK